MDEVSFKTVFFSTIILKIFRAANGNAYEVRLQDRQDPFYDAPKSLLEGCGCKGKCGNACLCKKSEKRMKRCSMLTCRKCSCFKREMDSEEENLRLSTRYQDYIDGLSSDSDLESQRSGNVSVAASDSEEEFDEALDYDDYRLY